MRQSSKGEPRIWSLAQLAFNIKATLINLEELGEALDSWTLPGGLFRELDSDYRDDQRELDKE